MGYYREVEQGASRYVVGKIEPFDQKNEMFKRPLWDPRVADIGKRFYQDPVMPRDKPGRRLKDQSLVNASWRLDQEFAHGAMGMGIGRVGLYGWSWGGKCIFPNVPAGLRTTETDPASMTRDIKRAATFLGASLVGICELDRRWLYSHAYRVTPTDGGIVENNIPNEFRYAIAIAIEMDYEAIRCSPAFPAGAAAGLGYSRMAFVAGMLAQYIRGLGYQAIPTGNDTALSIPIAIDAGFGEIARNGLLVTPWFGPRVRLAKVLTDLPLVPDKPIEFGVRDFCRICNKCVKNCPSHSIQSGEPSEKTFNISNREGVGTWLVNAETCLDFWTKNGGDCANCIRTCPFNKPRDSRLHEVVRWGVFNTHWLNKLFLWGDDFFGYGKRGNSNRFWEYRD
uniref:Reductive dehalogenase n=1 Tax=Candidatus Kentrum sp. FW TaxID=2126338 RepID=A0A450RZS8_9GAMM|nr:MAG: reductive dehalogenase [Candidatus Kentron sp. FW]